MREGHRSTPPAAILANQCRRYSGLLDIDKISAVALNQLIHVEPPAPAASNTMTPHVNLMGFEVTQGLDDDRAVAGVVANARLGGRIQGVDLAP